MKPMASPRPRAVRTTSPTQLRRRPAQERARQTFERLLDAAAAILDEEGLPALNTNAVAARAGLTVPALYRYFPDKAAVLVALAERYLEAERSWTTSIDRLGDASVPLGPVVFEIVRGYARAAAAHPAIAPLRSAMRALPELAELEERSLADSAARLDRALAVRFPALAGAPRAAAARVVVETVCNGVDRSRGRTPADQRRRLDGLAAMVSAYLEALASSVASARSES